MKNNIKKAGMALASLLLIVSFQNCAQQKFGSSGLGSNGGALHLGTSDDDASGVVTQTGGPNCRDELRALTTPVKMVFVVDVSGSNVSNPGSDPQKAVRGGSIQRFYNSFAGRSNFSWTFITFNGASAQTLVANGNAAAMQSALNVFAGIPDVGNTPYSQALTAAQQSISSDAGRQPNTKYIVVFLSDGMPNPSISDANLNQKVSEVTGALPGSVNLNSVYYGPVNAGASNRLKMMANTGGGNFLDTNANPTGNAFLISDLVLIPGMVCN